MTLNLRIPGPMPLPDDVLEAVGAPMLNHRGPMCEEIIGRMTLNMQTLLQTRGDVYFFTASGTGAMEGAIVNSIAPGDAVLSASREAIFRVASRTASSWASFETPSTGL